MSGSNPYKQAARRLYEIAQSQQGFFTAKQAIRAGYAEKVHTYHVKAGNWIREHRGIYRLTEFPSSERPDLMLWYLWSQNRREVPQEHLIELPEIKIRSCRDHARAGWFVSRTRELFCEDVPEGGKLHFELAGLQKDLSVVSIFQGDYAKFDSMHKDSSRIEQAGRAETGEGFLVEFFLLIGRNEPAAGLGQAKTGCFADSHDLNEFRIDRQFSDGR